MILRENSLCSVSGPILTEQAQLLFDEVGCTHFLVVYGCNKLRKAQKKEEETLDLNGRVPMYLRSFLENDEFDHVLLSDGMYRDQPFFARLVTHNQYILSGRSVFLDEGVTWAAVFGCRVDGDTVECALPEDAEQNECFCKLPVCFWMKPVEEKKAGLFARFSRKQPSCVSYQIAVESRAGRTDKIGQIAVDYPAGGETRTLSIAGEEFGKTLEFIADVGARAPVVYLTDGTVGEETPYRAQGNETIEGTVVSQNDEILLVDVSPRR